MNPSQLQPLETRHPPHRPSAFQSMKRLSAGGLAGIVAKSFVAPVDRIKILFQVTSGKFSLRQVWTVIKDISREEGPKGFFKGNSATMLRVFPYAGVQFFTYDSLKGTRLRRTAKDHLDPSEGFVFGAIAGMVSALTTYPLDLARARLAVSVHQRGSTTLLCKQPRGPFGVLIQIIRLDGLSAIYRGILPTLCGIGPYAGIAFSLNDFCKTRVYTILNREPSTTDMLTIGGGAGLIAQSCTYPLEVLRRRMQTSGAVNHHSTAHTLFSSDVDVRISRRMNNSALRPSMGETLQMILEEQGIRGLFKGLSMNWIKGRIFPDHTFSQGPISISISFTTFELFKNILHV